jgi:hypothetical protein
MFSLRNGKAVKKNKFASQHFFAPNIAYLKTKYLAVHIIADIN